jgi:hypothetical protein
MKRTLVFVAVLMLVPMAAFGMEELTDDVMGDITGQAGVTIEFVGTTTVQATSSGVAWGDPDGEAAYATDVDGDTIADNLPAHVRVDGAMTTTTTVGDGYMTIDLEGSRGVVIGLEHMDVDVEMTAAVLQISSGAGSATPDWGVDPAAIPLDQVLGVVSLGSTAVDLTLPTALVIRPH